SRSGYMFDKETNSIYQGVAPIKFLNENVAEGLYGKRDKKYDTFTDLLVDIKDGTMLDLLQSKSIAELKDIDKSLGKGRLEGMGTVPINSKQMKILIMLNYFSEFGG